MRRRREGSEGLVVRVGRYGSLADLAEAPGSGRVMIRAETMRQRIERETAAQAAEDQSRLDEQRARIALARAQLVKDMLVKEGIPAKSIRVKEQSGVYYATNDTPEGRAANRRAIVSFR